MKNQPSQPASALVTPPDMTLRENVTEPHATHAKAPVLRTHGQPGEHDRRPRVEAGGTPQRVRARQTEARTAAQCHVRVSRRPHAEAES